MIGYNELENTIMTPLQIKMMLHYYSIAEPYALREPEHARSNAVVTQREALIAGGMLEPCDAPIDWRVTDRGRAYVEALTHVPWPEKKWVMPGFEWPQQ